MDQLQAAHAQAMQALKDKLCILLEGFSSGELSPDTLLQELQLLGIDAQLPLPALAGSEPAQPEAAEAAGAEDVTPRERWELLSSALLCHSPSQLTLCQLAVRPAFSSIVTCDQTVITCRFFSFFLAGLLLVHSHCIGMLHRKRGN